MDPINFALAGSSIFSGVGGAVESGQNAGRTGNLSAMRQKEWMSAALLGVAGAAIAWREKAVWPILIAIGVTVLVIGLHEYHAAKSLPETDTSLVIGPWK